MDKVPAKPDKQQSFKPWEVKLTYFTCKKIQNLNASEPGLSSEQYNKLYLVVSPDLLDAGIQILV